MNRTQNFVTSSPINKAMIVVGLSLSKLKSILAPTEIKKRPSSNALKGSILDSSSYRYSLSAKTTPAKNVPNAADSPTSSMIKALAITKNRAKAVKISLDLDSAM